MIYVLMNHVKIKYFIVLFILLGFRSLNGQSSSFSLPWYWSSENYYILNKNVIHAHSDPSKNLFSQPANGALYYDNGDLVTFIPDPFWNRIIYANYNSNWVKAFGQYGPGNSEFKHPNAVTTDGYGWLFIVDTHNGRITSQFYNGTSISSFYPRGENIFDQPIDLDYDDLGDQFVDDIIWVVDRGLEEIVPLRYNPGNGNVYNLGSIHSLANPSTGETYADLSGVCGVAVRKNGLDDHVNSTAGERLYLIDWKLRKLFLVDANSISNGQATIVSEVTYSSNVQLSGIESDFFGNVWVVDNENGKLMKYTWDLEYLDEISGLNYPVGVAGVRRHHLNMAITEEWTNTTGNRTYSQGADIKNLSVSGGFDIANVSLKLTNYSKLVVKMYKGTTLEATLVDNLADGFVNASGTQSLNWLKENATWGNYTAKVWAYSYDDNAVYHYDSYNFSFALEAYLTGPDNLSYRQTGTFTAQTTGGSSSPTYQWYKKYDGSSTWHSLGTNQTQYSTMFNTGFTMKVVVSSGGETSTQTLHCASGSGEGGFNPKVLILPESYSLSQNHPNPFNPVTTIKYELPEPSKVTFIVYNLLGHEVVRWEKGYDDAGFRQFTWKGKNKYGQEVPTGMYFYKLTATSLESNKVFSENRKMVFLR